MPEGFGNRRGALHFTSPLVGEGAHLGCCVKEFLNGDQTMTKFTDIGVEKTGHVTTIEIQRPPLNFFDISLINQIADALTDIDNDPEARAVVLAAPGRACGAGANFNDPARQEQKAREKSDPASGLGQISHLY